MKNLKRTGLVKLGSLLLIAILALGFVGCSKEAGEEVVAKVGDQVITKDELYERMLAQGGEQLLNSMINEIVIDLEAKKAGVNVSSSDVDEELEAMIESYGGVDSFNEVVSYYGYNIEDMKNNISLNLKLKGLLSPRLEISDEDVRDYFDENLENFMEKEEIRASHILVEEKELAEELFAKLQAGEDFEELAKEHSIDGSAQAGGDLGFFGRGAMVQEFEEAAFGLKVGEISKPVQSQFGYHIIKMVEKKEAKEPVLEDFEEIIRDEILENSMNQLYEEWYHEIIDNYTIENSLLD